MSVFMVTGATGFIGSNLCRKLVCLGHEVHIICRKNSFLDTINDIKSLLNIHYISDNTEDLIMCFNNVNPNCVFHLASLLISEHTPNQVNSLIDSNIKFSTNILEAMKESNTKKIINTGTSLQHFTRENYNAACLYGATKEAFEKILEYYVDSENFKAITLKLFNVYGENDTKNNLFNSIKNIALKGQPLSLSKGEQLINLTHVDDIVEGYINAYEYMSNINYGNHKEFALCTNNMISIKEVIKMFETISCVNLDIQWGKKPYRKREVMVPYDNYEIIPNWSPKISLEKGIERICKIERVN